MSRRVKGIDERELRQLYDSEGMSMQTIANYYGVSRATIRRRIIEYEMERRARGNTKKRKLSINREDLEYKYNTETASMQDIANYYGCSLETIRNRLKEYDIEIRPRGVDRVISNKARKYSINKDFFKIWGKGSAWIFGWFLGDGWITSSRFGFGLSRADKEVLEKFKLVLGSQQPIEDYITRIRGYPKHYKMSRICFNSKLLANDLKELSYFDVPAQYFPDFLRGFFEADGCVSWGKNKRSIKGGSVRIDISQNDYGILDYILQCLHKFKIVEGGSINPVGVGYHLNFGKHDSVSLYPYMYGTCGNMFLKRKKERFKELIERQLC